MCRIGCPSLRVRVRVLNPRSGPRSRKSPSPWTYLFDPVGNGWSRSLSETAHQGALWTCAQRLLAPKPLSGNAGNRPGPEGGVPPPGPRPLSDREEGCQHVHSHSPLHPPQLPAPGSWGLGLWAYLAREPRAGQALRAQRGATGQIVVTLKGTGKGWELGPFCCAPVLGSAPRPSTASSRKSPRLPCRASVFPAPTPSRVCPHR